MGTLNTLTVYAVLKLIPTDGIQFNELKDKCLQKRIGNKTVLNVLDKLQADGKIVKVPVLGEKGAVTVYKRVSSQSATHTAHQVDMTIHILKETLRSVLKRDPSVVDDYILESSKCLLNKPDLYLIKPKKIEDIDVIMVSTQKREDFTFSFKSGAVL